jgi:hypothetical protein
LISQNNISLYTPTDRARQIPTSLMGDPTLRLHPMVPPSSLELNVTGCSVDISWTPSTEDSVLGYHVYRSNSIDGQFQRLSSDPVTESCWWDDSPLYGNNVYMIRAYKLEVAGSGSYYNLSAGIVDSATVTCGDEGPDPPLTNVLCRSYPNPFSESARIDFYLAGPGLITLAVYDLCGRIVAEIYSGEPAGGFHSIEWNGTTDNGELLGNGNYFYRLSSPLGDLNGHLSIVR